MNPSAATKTESKKKKPCALCAMTDAVATAKLTVNPTFVICQQRSVFDNPADRDRQSGIPDHSCAPLPPNDSRNASHEPPPDLRDRSAERRQRALVIVSDVILYNLAMASAC